MSKAIVVVDLGFGDAGKGSITDYLVRKHGASAVVRYNGGPQAAHRVVLDDGREHVFSQFGSGTFVDGVETFLGEQMLVNPLNLLREGIALAAADVDAFPRMAIDRCCVVITPMHRAANRIRELARDRARHGSCGEGIGEARSDYLHGLAVLVGDLGKPDLVDRLKKIYDSKLAEIQPEIRALEFDDIPYDLGIFGLGPEALSDLADDYRAFADWVRVVNFDYLAELHRRGPVVYEGAQGVLLDQDFGFHPYTTWSRTTSDDAQVLLSRMPMREMEKIGVLRAYGTRHGPGPFPTEDHELSLPDAENGFNEWQRGFRVGRFDALLARYAIRATRGITGLALTCMDRLEEFKIAKAYRYAGGLSDLSPYFTIDGEQAIRGIAPPDEPLKSHAHVEALGTRLADCRPIYETCHIDDAVRVVQDTLDTKVVLTSWGPTASDKVETHIPAAA